MEAPATPQKLEDPMVYSAHFAAEAESAGAPGGQAARAGDTVLALVPAHDEAPRVGAVVRGLIAHGLTVLVVDDGSTDDTGKVAQKAGAHVLRLEPNRGKGAALKAGFRLALSRRSDEGSFLGALDDDADSRSGGGPSAPDSGPSISGPGVGRWAAILTLDGDGQHDPAEVPAFLEAWHKTGADLVVGARDYRRMPPIRWFTNTMSRLLFSWALGQAIRDNQSGYRLRSRRLAATVLASPEEGFAFEVEEIAICVGRGYQLAWVPVRTIYGTETSDIKPWTHFVSFVRVTARARKRVREERSRISGH
jgi:glycosyltransferase involved in cell wall biosynthesis